MIESRFLFVAQSFNRVDFCRAPGRVQTGKDTGADRERHRDADPERREGIVPFQRRGHNQADYGPQENVLKVMRCITIRPWNLNPLRPDGGIAYFDRKWRGIPYWIALRCFLPQITARINWRKKWNSQDKKND